MTSTSELSVTKLFSTAQNIVYCHCQVALTLTVPVTAIDALRHFETG